jgi:WD40 repeat protein
MTARALDQLPTMRWFLEPTAAVVIVRDREGRELRRFDGGSVAERSPDGRLLLTATPGNAIAIWDQAKGKRVLELGAFDVKVLSLKWSSDGRRFAAMGGGGKVYVWNIDGTVVREIPQRSLPVGYIAFSHDGKWLVRTGECADTLFALDGGADRRLPDVRGPVLVARFSPDDSTVLLAGTSFIATWDVATGKLKLHLATNTWITAAAFLDGGRYITARGAMIWRIPAFTGTLEELRGLALCRLDVEIRDAHVTAHAIDVKACNRAAR